MNFFSTTSIFVFLASLLMGLLFFFRGGERRVSRLLGLTCIAASAWALGAYKFSSTLNKDAVLFWIKIAHVGIILTPTFFVHFVCKWSKCYKKLFIVLLYSLATLFLGYTFFYKEFFGIKFVFDSFYFFTCDVARNPVYLILYIAFYLVFLLYAFYLLIAFFKRSSGILRNQLRYFIICLY